MYVSNKHLSLTESNKCSFSLEPEDKIQDIMPSEARNSNATKQIKLIFFINDFIIYIPLHKDDLFSLSSDVLANQTPSGYHLF